MKCAAAVVLLSLLSVGRSAEPEQCETLVKPITISNEEMLGKWLYIGGSSDIPGSRSLGRLMTSVWLQITATSQPNILTLLQTQRIYGSCSSLLYNVTFENSRMLIEKPFHLEEVYLPTDCSDCLVVHEEIQSDGNVFKSLLLFSRRQSIPPAHTEMLKKQAECLQMPAPLMLDTNEEICPDNLPPSEGLSAYMSLLNAKMGHRVARVLDAVFDFFGV